MNLENAVKEARLRSPRLCSSTSRTAQSWLNWGELVELGLAVAAGGRQDKFSPSFVCAGVGVGGHEGYTHSAVPSHSTAWFWSCTAPAPRHEASGIYSGMLGSLLGCFIII